MKIPNSGVSIKPNTLRNMAWTNAMRREILFQFSAGSDIAPEPNPIAGADGNYKCLAALILIMLLPLLKDFISSRGIFRIGIVGDLGSYQSVDQ